MPKTRHYRIAEQFLPKCDVHEALWEHNEGFATLGTSVFRR